MLKKMIFPILIIAILTNIFVNCQPTMPRERVDLISFFEGSISHSKQDEGCCVESKMITVDGEQKKSFFFNRPGLVKIPFKCPKNACLSFYVSMISAEPAVTTLAENYKPILFEVTVKTDIPDLNRTFSYKMNSLSLPDEWMPIKINLDQFSDQIVSLSLNWLNNLQNFDTHLVCGALTLESDRLPETTFHKTGIQSNSFDKLERPGDNVVIILIDTIRADCMGFGGHPNIKTATLDWLSKQGISLTHFISSSSWTKPAVGTLFTGLSSYSHKTNNRTDRLNPNIPTLAEKFFENGYSTFGFVGNGNVTEYYGFNRGFDVYKFYSGLGETSDRKIKNKKIWKVDSQLLEGVLSVFQQLDEKTPFFMYIHLCNPHLPYIPLRNFYSTDYSGNFDGSTRSLKTLRTYGPDRMQKDIDHVYSLYQTEITEADQNVWKLLKSLQYYELFNKTTIIFLSDHGDEFYEHGNFGHGNNLHTELVRIPFLLIPSGYHSKPILYPSPVYLEDVYPTLIDMFQLHTNDKTLLKRSILERIMGIDTRSEKENAFLYLEIDQKRSAALIVDNYKLIETEGGSTELYNMDDDYFERHNLVKRLSIRSDYLRYLMRFEKNRQQEISSHYFTSDLQGSVEPAEPLDEELKQHLKYLGYLDN